MVDIDKKGSGGSQQHEKKAPNSGKKQAYLLNFTALPFFSSKAIFISEIFLNVVLFIFKVYHAIFKAYKMTKENTTHRYVSNTQLKK